MNQSLLFELLLIIVQVAIVVVGGYVVSYLKAKVGTENFNKYYGMIKSIVMGIEQTFGAGNGADKKTEAVQLIEKIAGNKLSEDQINTLIESAVFEMNLVIKNGGETTKQV